MILVSFFEILYGDRLTKNVQKLRIQVIPRSTYRVMQAKRLQNYNPLKFAPTRDETQASSIAILAERD